MASIRITHTHAEGTLLDGSVKGDGVYEIVKRHNFTWFRSIRRIGIRGSRDHHPQWHHINQAKAALEAAGFTVEVEIDDRARAAAEVERDRDEQLADRQDALDAKADRLISRGDATVAHARQLADAIPFGQPLQPPSHHSYRADVNYRKRMRRTFERGFATLKEGESAADRAEASRRHQAYLKTGPVTERRIAGLEADRRKIERYMAPCELSGRKTTKEGTDGRTVPCALCGEDVTIAGRQIPEHRRSTVDSEWAAQRLAEIDDQLGHERQRLADLQAGGYKKWGPDDFEKGDWVKYWGGWAEVLKVNRRSLTVPSGYSWTSTISYDKVIGRRRKAELTGQQRAAGYIAGIRRMDGEWKRYATDVLAALLAGAELPDLAGYRGLDIDEQGAQDVRVDLRRLLTEGGHDCLQGPLCHRWHDGGSAPIDGCGHRTCMEIVNDVARCPACVREHQEESGE